MEDLLKVSGSYSRSDSLREEREEEEAEDDDDSASLTVTFFFFTMGLDEGEDDLRLLVAAGEGAGAVEALKLEERSFWPRDAEVEVERRSEPEGAGGRLGFSEEGGVSWADDGEVFSVFLDDFGRGEIRSTSPFLLTI